jgi:hypothetical protein
MSRWQRACGGCWTTEGRRRGARTVEEAVKMVVAAARALLTWPLSRSSSMMTKSSPRRWRGRRGICTRVTGRLAVMAAAVAAAAQGPAV